MRVPLIALLAVAMTSASEASAARLVQFKTALGGLRLPISLDAPVGPASTVFVFAGNYCFCNRAIQVNDTVGNAFVAIRTTERGIASSTQSWVIPAPKPGTQAFEVTSAANQLAVTVLEYEGLQGAPIEASTEAVQTVTTTVTTPAVAVPAGGIVLGFAWDQTSFGPESVWSSRNVDRSAQLVTVFGSMPLGLTMVVAQDVSPVGFVANLTFSRSDGARSNGLHAVMMTLRTGPSTDAGFEWFDAGALDAGAAALDAGVADAGFGLADGGVDSGVPPPTSEDGPAKGRASYRVGCSASPVQLVQLALLSLVTLRRTKPMVRTGLTSRT